MGLEGGYRRRLDHPGGNRLHGCPYPITEERDHGDGVGGGVFGSQSGQGYITLRVVSGASYHLDAEIYDVIRALKGRGEWYFGER